MASIILTEAYETLGKALGADQFTMDSGKIANAVETIRDLPPRETYGDLSGITGLEPKLGLMVVAAVTENKVGDDYAKRLDISKGKAIYKALITAHEGGEILFTLDALIRTVPGEGTLGEVLSDEGIGIIAELAGKLQPYGQDGAQPFSSLITGRAIYNEEEAKAKPITILGETGLEKRLSDLGYGSQGWVIRVIARGDLGLKFSDIKDTTVFPSSSIRAALELHYGVVTKWPEDPTVRDKCAIAVADMLSRHSGVPALLLDGHFYDVGDAAKRKAAQNKT